MTSQQVRDIVTAMGLSELEIPASESPTLGTLATFKKLGRERNYDMFPEHLRVLKYDFREMTNSGTPFYSDIASGAPTITFGADGLKVVTNGAISRWMRAGKSLQGSWWGMEIEVKDMTADVGSYSNLIMCLANTAAVQRFGLMIQRVEGKINYFIEKTGSSTVVTDIHTIEADDFSLRLCCTGEELLVYINYGIGWREIAKLRQQSGYFNYNDQVLYDGNWEPTITLDSTMDTTFKILRFEVGYLGAVSYADLHPINTLETCEPVILNNKAFFTASLNMPAGATGSTATTPLIGTGLGVISVDLTSLATKIESLLFVKQTVSGTVKNFKHRSSQVCYDEANLKWLCFSIDSSSNVLGSFAGVFPAKLETYDNLLSGVHVFPDCAGLFFKPEGALMHSCYDVAVVKQGSTFYLAYTKQSVANVFTTVIASTPDFVTFTILLDDTGHQQSEGNKAIFLNGVIRFMSGRNNSTMNVYSITGTFLRAISQPEPVGIQTIPPSHPCIIPYHKMGNTHYLYLGFDAVIHPGNLVSYGNVNFYDGVEYDTGYTFPKRKVRIIGV